MLKKPYPDEIQWIRAYHAIEPFILRKPWPPLLPCNDALTE